MEKTKEIKKLIWACRIHGFIWGVGILGILLYLRGRTVLDISTDVEYKVDK